MKHTTIHVSQILSARTTAQVDLPAGIDYSMISEWFVKWDTFHYCANGTWYEESMDSDTCDIIDLKRPLSVDVLAHDSIDDIADWGNKLESSNTSGSIK